MSPVDAVLPWTPVQRVLFRISFVFLTLTLFPFPFNYWGVYPTRFYEKMWSAIASWLSSRLDLPPTPAFASGGILFDNVNGYVEIVCFAVLALLAATIWTIVDRNRPHYRTLHSWLRVYVRYALAYAMLGYGMDKVFALQFNTSLPGPGRLAEPLGNYSPFALMWTFMGYSKPYTIFAGVGEVIGGVLLLFRRTTMLGALVVCGVMANVVALDFSYQVGVKIFACLLLVLAMFLLAPDLTRLSNLFLLNRTTSTSNLGYPKKPPVLLHMAVVVFLLYRTAGPDLQIQRRRVNSPKSPLYGLYQVETFTENGKPVEQSGSNWRRVIFELKGDMTVISTDDSMHYYGADVEPVANTVSISGEYEQLRSRSGSYGDSEINNHNLNSILTYSRPDAEHLELRGNLSGNAVTISMRKIDISQFTLISRGFHWVENGPFYR